MWLGALCRLDLISGSDKFFTFYVPLNIPIHRTPLERAEQVYLDRAGTLLGPTYDEKPENVEFERHEISLDCTQFKLANFDVSIEGLGWFSVQGTGFITMFLNLPFGIKYHIRDTPMRPHEV